MAAFFFVPIALLLITTIHAAMHGGGSPNFTYAGDTGPTKWGHLNPTYGTCSIGKSQSPIDIVTGNAIIGKHLKPLKCVYSAVNATLVNHGYNVGMEFGNAGVLYLDGKNYTLQQMHWHTPSEHTIDGVLMDAELHLVHHASDSSAAVIGIFYKIGSPDPIIRKMLRNLEVLAEEERKRKELGKIPVGVFKAWRVKRNIRKYYRYVGSLTTPPCTENVTWHVLAKVRSISKEQIEALRAPLESTCKTNHRPVQPLNGRKVELYDGFK